MCGATEPTNSAEGPYLRGRSHGHSGRMPFAFVAVALVVLGVNVLPAFGPPTWALLVLFHLHWHLAPVPLIVVGALSAASGRLLLAAATARLQGRLSETRRARIARLGATVQQHKTSAVAGLVLFALSPVPSGQLFVAAGLLRLRIRPLTLAFFAGRVVSYSLYLTAAQVAEMVFHAMRHDQFYIYSHPKALGNAQSRFDAIVAGTNPPDPFAERPEIGEGLRQALRAG